MNSFLIVVVNFNVLLLNINLVSLYVGNMKYKNKHFPCIFNGKELFKNILARSEQVKKIILPLHRSNEKDS